MCGMLRVNAGDGGRAIDGPDEMCEAQSPDGGGKDE